jgi:hypothetical protein
LAQLYLKHTKLPFLIAIGLICFAGLTRWQTLSEDPIIQTDGQGYHAYLPAVFIYQDLQFDFVDSLNQIYYPEDKRAQFIVPSEEGNVNKYFVGTAIVQAPFFLVGCAVSWVLGVPVDGYAWSFQLMSGFAAIACLSLGLWFLGRLLLAMAFGRFATLATLPFIFFGTNLLHYTLYAPAMSHVYSFFTISAFLFFIHKAFSEQHGRSLLFAALAIGLTVLIRPINGLVMFGIPVLTSGVFGTVNGIEAFLSEKKALLSAIAIGLLVVMIQPFIYFLQTGSPIVWSYQEEGFNFSSPELMNVLFSYRKGLFVYCPILFLAVLGMVSGAVRETARYAWLMFFLFAVSWVIASWWMWFYGGSYGHRAFIEYYPFFAIGLARLLHRGWWIFRPMFFAFLGFALVGIQFVQTYQYHIDIIPFDNMNKTKYWNLFLRTGQDLRWYYPGYEGEDSYVGKDSVVVKHDMESERGWGNENQRTNQHSWDGKFSVAMGPTQDYGITFRQSVSELRLSPDVVRVGAWVKSNARCSNVAFVFAIEDSTGASYCWKSRALRPQFEGRNEWSWVEAVFKCGFPRDSTDRFILYPMKSDRSIVYFDNLEVSFITTQ